MGLQVTSVDGQERATAGESGEAAGIRAKSFLGPSIKIAGLVFALVLGAIAVTAWFSGEPEELPFDYEGFD